MSLMREAWGYRRTPAGKLDGAPARSDGRGLLCHSLTQRGLKSLMSAQISAILGNEHVTGMRFKDPDDSEIEDDLVMMAVGIRPNAALARCPPALQQRRGGERHHAVLRSVHLCHRRVR
jgi:hypothetical protein